MDSEFSIVAKVKLIADNLKDFQKKVQTATTISGKPTVIATPVGKGGAGGGGISIGDLTKVLGKKGGEFTKISGQLEGALGKMGKASGYLAIIMGAILAIKKGIDFLSKASPALQQVVDMFGTVFMLFFKPFGDLLAFLLRPWLFLMIKALHSWFKLFDLMYLFFRNPFQALEQYRQLIESIKAMIYLFAEKILEWAAGLAYSIAVALGDVLKSMFDGVIDILKGIWDILKAIYDFFKNLGSGFGQGFGAILPTRGIQKGAETAIQWFTSMGGFG